MIDNQEGKPTKPRKQGRPAGVPTGKLQDLILDAAEQLFAEKGFDATSVRDITSMAGVNPALVHYYFGSKQDLLKMVMQRALEPLTLAISEISQSSESPVDKFVDLAFQALSEHPALPRLVVREVMLSSGEIQSHFLQHFAPRLGGALPDIVKQQQEAGSLNQELQPGITAMMVLSLCMFPMIARPVSETALGVGYDEAGLDQIRRHIHLLLDSGLKS